MPLPEHFEQLSEQADLIGIRLEMVDGTPIWEAMSSPRHQREIDRIRSSIRRAEGIGSDCGCVTYADVSVRFSHDSFRRPDVAIFCREPDEEFEAVTLVPEAVIEVVSKGYEAKDTTLGPPFYLRHGVKDVVVFDPRSGRVEHHRAEGAETHTSPIHLLFACGCSATV